MELVRIRNINEFNAHISKEYHKRMAVEKLIADENMFNKSWELIGFCDACGKATKFLMDWFNCYEHPLYGKTPSYRERIVCRYCGLNNRQRFMASYLRPLIDSNKKPALTVYLYEQLTPFYEYIKYAFRSVSLIGSEYFGDRYKPAQVVNGVRHEDALCLSFKDKTIDVMVANDVFEHVPDIDKTFEEAFRVLNDGGKLVFSIPFQSQETQIHQRAVIRHGDITHLLPETYHSNPVSEKGSLVFFDFGWDIFESCRNAGFSDIYMLSYYSLMYGYLGNGLQYIFVASKEKQ